MSGGDRLREIVAAEAARPVPEAVAAHARALAARPGALAVLHYGNTLRDPAAGGLVDLYVLTGGDRAWHGWWLPALANRLLPPSVVFAPPPQDAPAGAKVAVMTLGAFRRRMRRGSWDTTLWARFAQPARIAAVRDEATRGEVLAALEDAARTASWWAARLSAEDAGWEDAWTALFRATYGAELRVEGSDRAAAIVAAAPERYRALHAALAGGGPVGAAGRARAQRRWRRRRLAGKALNVARLAKAAFTFPDGIAYALSKVERHGGAPVPLKAWERRLPWLAAPFVMLRLVRARRLR